MPHPNPFCYVDLLIKTPLATRKCRLHYALTAVPTVYNHVQAIANASHGALSGTVKDVMPTEVSIIGTVARYIDGSVDFEAPSTSTAVPGAAVFGTEIDGDDDQFTMPDEACLIFRKVTGLGGRSKRGRIFLPGIHEAVNDEGRVHDSMKATVKAIAVALTDGIGVSYTSPGGVESDYTATMNLRLFDQKNNVMVPVMKVVALDLIGSRYDRRKPMGYDVLT